MSDDPKPLHLLDIPDNDPHVYLTEVAGILMISGPVFRKGLKEAMRELAAAKHITFINVPSKEERKKKKELSDKNESSRQRARGKFTR